MEAKLHQHHHKKSPDRKKAPRYLLSLGLATLALLLLSGCGSSEPSNKIHAFNTLLSPSNSVEVLTNEGGVSRADVQHINPSCDVAQQYPESYQHVAEVCDTVDQMISTLQPDEATTEVLSEVPQYTFFLPDHEFTGYCEPQASACARSGIVYSRDAIFSNPGNDYLQRSITAEEAVHVVQQLGSEDFTLPLENGGGCVVVQDGAMYIIGSPNSPSGKATEELPAALVATAMDPNNGSPYIRTHDQTVRDVFRDVALRPGIARQALMAYNSEGALAGFLTSLGEINPQSGMPLTDGIAVLQTLGTFLPPAEVDAHISPPTTCSNP